MPKVNATDIDARDNGTAGIRYSLTGGGSQHFCIDRLTAVIELCLASLDWEKEPNYQLQVTNRVLRFIINAEFPRSMSLIEMLE